MSACLSPRNFFFARQGIDKTSTRDITAEAAVNTAAVNYYFRSKEALAEEIFTRLAQRFTVLLLADLSRFMDASRESRTPLRLEDLVDCFIRPYFEPGVHGALLARFILQLMELLAGHRRAGPPNWPSCQPNPARTDLGVRAKARILAIRAPRCSGPRSLCWHIQLATLSCMSL